MFKKILASVGIGGAKVDTILHKETLYPGDTFEATVMIKGGETEQEISGLDLALAARVKQEVDDAEVYLSKTLAKWHLADQFTLQPHETREIPVSGELPLETPITSNNARNNQTQVWIATGLNIDMALDARDKDILNIIPTPTQAAVLKAMEECGYSLVKADVEKGGLRAPNFQSTLGCYQELEYRPNSFALFGLKEVEVSFVPTPTETHILFELDRAFGGDSYRSMTLANTLGQDEITARIKQLLG
ncbi:sporulation protein [Marinospirillum perlucidum]|uniref:sporulation protein n=1 Tax=Marinospirillum perlucidum TaxID=1982602 RepID=UPI000DF47384|nr:sporulation protein [Marinospirillum perlucidum]